MARAGDWLLGRSLGHPPGDLSCWLEDCGFKDHGLRLGGDHRTDITGVKCPELSARYPGATSSRIAPPGQ